jgi:predicted enzyme related to lactoylglutathione lyase
MRFDRLRAYLYAICADPPVLTAHRTSSRPEFRPNRLPDRARRSAGMPSPQACRLGGRFCDHGGVTSRIAVIALDAVEPRVVADFWCRVLGWQIVDENTDGLSIAAADGAGPTIDVLAVPEGKAVKNRLHLDLRADGMTTAEELDRLLSLGARPTDVGQEPGVSWVVLSDPEGNEFCLLSRSVQEVSGG